MRSVTLWLVSTAAPVRVVVAKPGLDGHDRGAKVVARALRDAGVEVVYTGLHQTPEQIVETAIQEDADAIGMSVLSGAHMTLFARVIELLRERDASDIVVFGGGIVPEADLPELTEMGVAKVFTPGATTGEIVAWVRENLRCAGRELTTGDRPGSGRRIRSRSGPETDRTHRGLTHVDLFEYQARDLFEKHGVPVLGGAVAETPEEARAAAERLLPEGGGKVVVKAQVKVGGRGKAGGVKLASSVEEAEQVAGADPRHGHQGPHRAPGDDRAGRSDRGGVLLLGAARPRQPHLPGDGLPRGRHGDRAARGREARGAGPGPGRRARRASTTPRRARSPRRAASRPTSPTRWSAADPEALGRLRRRGRHAGRGQPAGEDRRRPDRRARRQGDPRRQRRLPAARPRRRWRTRPPPTRWRRRPRRRTSTTSSSTARSASSATAPAW